MTIIAILLAFALCHFVRELGRFRHNKWLGSWINFANDAFGKFPGWQDILGFFILIALPALLLWHRTRRFAMVASIALFLAIQIGAREIFFGGLMVGLLLLFSRRDRVATATPWIGAVYLVWLLEPELSRWLSSGSTP